MAIPIIDVNIVWTLLVWSPFPLVQKFNFLMLQRGSNDWFYVSSVIVLALISSLMHLTYLYDLPMPEVEIITNCQNLD